MYLKRLFVENCGPVRRLNVSLPLVNGNPKPLILAGENGSGKTNLLSIVADALFEAAAKHYTDVVNSANGVVRPWFRILGPWTISAGASGACVFLEFDNQARSAFYREKIGSVATAEVAERLPESMKTIAAWGEGATKEFLASEEDCKLIFEQGVYLYFPSSRSETPHWLNREGLPNALFNVTQKITKQLQKPIYVESGMALLKQWLLALLIDVRVDFTTIQLPNGQNVASVFGDTALAVRQQTVWRSMNVILQRVLGDSSAHFVWTGQEGTANLGFVSAASAPHALPLEALSAGQATLLNIFGTLLRYGQGTTSAPTTPDKVRGICIVDEIDAHMHVDLQYRALPVLLKLFPGVQFLLSSHSPLFILGAEHEFGPDGFELLEMPRGHPMRPEAYAEFGRAFDVLRSTKTFAEAVLSAAGEANQKLLVLLEGETDPVYLASAATRHGRAELLQKVQLEWIGSKDPQTGQGFHTGKDALNTTLKLLRAKPELLHRRILLLYDNDANKAPEDFENVYVRCVPSNPDNESVKAGIENLLPADVVTEDMFDVSETTKPNGTISIIKTLNKMRLCKNVCEERSVDGDFARFAEVLDQIEALTSA
jgi:hypothetical protein